MNLVLSLNVTAPPEIYTLSLHDALPISLPLHRDFIHEQDRDVFGAGYFDRRNGRKRVATGAPCVLDVASDRKSTRLNSSHTVISYAVFCLKKKNKRKHTTNKHMSHHHVT